MEDPNLVRQFDPLFHTSADHYNTLPGGIPSHDYNTSLDIFKHKEKHPLPPSTTSTTTTNVYVDMDSFYQQERPSKILKPNNTFEDFQYQTTNTNNHWNNHSMGMTFNASLHPPQQHMDSYAMLRDEGRQTQVESPVSVGTTKMDPTSIDGLRGSSPLSSIEYVQQQGKAKQGFFPANVTDATRMGMVNVPAPVVKSTGHTQDHIMAERKRREKLSQRFIALSAIVPGLKKVLCGELLVGFVMAV